MPTVTIPVELADRWFDWRVRCDHVPCISHAAIWWLAQVDEKEFDRAVEAYRAWEGRTLDSRLRGNDGEDGNDGEGGNEGEGERFREYGELLWFAGDGR